MPVPTPPQPNPNLDVTFAEEVYKRVGQMVNVNFTMGGGNQTAKLSAVYADSLVLEFNPGDWRIIRFAAIQDVTEIPQEVAQAQMALQRAVSRTATGSRSS